MKTTIDFYKFQQEFVDSGRGDQFTNKGLKVLFDYLEQLEDDLGEEIELDVIALCCDYAEGTPEEIAEENDIDLSDCDDDEEKMEDVVKYLENETSVVGETGSTILYQQF